MELIKKEDKKKDSASNDNAAADESGEEEEEELELDIQSMTPAKLSIGFIKRLSVVQMKDELRKRNVLTAKNAKRAELKRMLLTWMDKEKAANPSKAELKRRLQAKKKQEQEEQEGSEEEEEEPDSKSKSKSKKKRARDAEDDEELGERAKKIQKYDFKKKRTEVELLEELLNLVEQYGTKMGNLVYYLRRLWEQTPDARVILFSQVGEF